MNRPNSSAWFWPRASDDLTTSSLAHAPAHEALVEWASSSPCIPAPGTCSLPAGVLRTARAATRSRMQERPAAGRLSMQHLRCARDGTVGAYTSHATESLDHAALGTPAQPAGW